MGWWDLDAQTGAELVHAVKPPTALFGPSAKHRIATRANQPFCPVEASFQAGSVAEAAVSNNDQSPISTTNSVQLSPQSLGHAYSMLGKIAEFAGQFPLADLFERSPLARPLDARRLLEPYRDCPGAQAGFDALGWHKNRSLKKTQPPHQVHMEWRRHRIALLEGLRNAATCFVQTGIVQSHSDQGAFAQRQSLFEDGSEQGLRFPLASRVQVVLGGPRLLFISVGPDDTGDGAAADTQERAQGLAHGPNEGSDLGEAGLPVGGNPEK